jgi:hypothetical protein
MPIKWCCGYSIQYCDSEIVETAVKFATRTAALKKKQKLLEVEVQWIFTSVVCGHLEGRK